MYKVFYNQRTVLFTDDVENIQNAKDQNVHHFRNKRTLKKVIHSFTKHQNNDTLIVFCKDLDETFKKYKKLYKVIEAAGGLVQNTNSAFLFIYRRDKWDLPKGKIEKNEDPKTGAVREVEEECGIHNPKITKELSITYHTYNLKGKDILKKTYWYEMYYDGTEPLKPQIEEEIKIAAWFNKSEFNQVYENTFPSIIDVIANYRKNK